MSGIGYHGGSSLAVKTMAEYQQIEYRIRPDGQVVETVLGATGEACVSVTDEIEQAIGAVATREYLPEYYAEVADVTIATVQQSQQQ
jgi:Protein of unknown function (DUF2997)